MMRKWNGSEIKEKAKEIFCGAIIGHRYEFTGIMYQTCKVCGRLNVVRATPISELRERYREIDKNRVY